MLLEVLSDIPKYRLAQYPAHVQIHTWESSGHNVLEGTDFQRLIHQSILTCGNWRLRKADPVCILASAGHGVLFAFEFAVMHLGGIVVPIHLGLPDADMQVIFSEVKPRYTVTADPRVAERLHGFRDNGFVHVIGDTATAVDEKSIPKPICTPDDPALIIYTSGSTGVPKGVVLTHRNVIATVRSLLPVIPVRYGHTVLSYLPVSHIFERIACYCYLVAGVHIHFAEPRNAMVLLKRIRPHYFAAVPRILDTAMERFVRAGDTRHYFVRSILLWALESGQGPGRWARTLLRKLILRRFKRSFGGRVRGILVGGAALHPATESLFRDAGISVRVGYGLSECCGVATMNRFEPGGQKRGTVGLPIPGVEVRIDLRPGEKEGEVYIRGAGNMQGYFLRDDETSEILTSDGWLKTGDNGEWIDGRFLRITGRSKEQFKNAYGVYVSPSKIEQLLEHDAWINRALVTGSGRESTGALIVPNFDVLEDWAIREKVHWTAPLYMVHNTQVLLEFDKRIARINSELPVQEQIRRFRLLHEPWTIEQGLVTPSFKLRRDVIETHYRKVIDEMYA